MPLRLPDPGSFKARLGPVLVPVASLVRLSNYPASEPYWGKRAASRFDAPKEISPADRFGVCYAGDCLETAFAESVIHDGIDYRADGFVVAEADILSRHWTTFALPARTELKMVDLTGHALKSLGLNNDISSGDAYATPQAWAAAVHAHDPSWDGIRSVSRQNKERFCYAIFERSAMTVVETRPLATREMAHLCDAFRVSTI